MAAGLGTRMKSDVPKHLHPILGRRMVDWVLESSRAAISWRDSPTDEFGGSASSDPTMSTTSRLAGYRERRDEFFRSHENSPLTDEQRLEITLFELNLVTAQHAEREHGQHGKPDLEDWWRQIDDWREFLGVTSRTHTKPFPIPVKVAARDHPAMLQTILRISGLLPTSRVEEGEAVLADR